MCLAYGNVFPRTIGIIFKKWKFSKIFLNCFWFYTEYDGRNLYKVQQNAIYLCDDSDISIVK